MVFIFYGLIQSLYQRKGTGYKQLFTSILSRKTNFAGKLTRSKLFQNGRVDYRYGRLLLVKEVLN